MHTGRKWTSTSNSILNVQLRVYLIKRFSNLRQFVFRKMMIGHFEEKYRSRMRFLQIICTNVETQKYRCVCLSGPCRVSEQHTSLSISNASYWSTSTTCDQIWSLKCIPRGFAIVFYGFPFRWNIVLAHFQILSLLTTSNLPKFGRDRGFYNFYPSCMHKPLFLSDVNLQSRSHVRRLAFLCNHNAIFFQFFQFDVPVWQNYFSVSFRR